MDGNEGRHWLLFNPSSIFWLIDSLFGLLNVRRCWSVSDVLHCLWSPTQRCSVWFHWRGKKMFNVEKLGSQDLVQLKRSLASKGWKRKHETRQAFYCMLYNSIGKHPQCGGFSFILLIQKWTEVNCEWSWGEANISEPWTILRLQPRP